MNEETKQVMKAVEGMVNERVTAMNAEWKNNGVAIIAERVAWELEKNAAHLRIAAQFCRNRIKAREDKHLSILLEVQGALSQIAEGETPQEAMRELAWKIEKDVATVTKSMQLD